MCRQKRHTEVTTGRCGPATRRLYKAIHGLALLLSLLLPLAAAYAQSDIDFSQQNIFGVVEGFWLPDDVCELNPGWERIIFDWAQHQPTGPDDWHTLNVDDRWLAAARDCNREVVALLKHTPGWATDGSAGIGVPRGLDLPIDDPGNVWANFVRRAAEYYAPRGVNHFIIWNEPDITPDTYGYEFEGTLDDYYQMLRVAYLAAKEGNPDAVIHLAGTTYWHDVNAGRRLYVDRLLERIEQDPQAGDNDHYFDVLSLHIYFRTDSIYEIVAAMRSLLADYGLGDKGVWVNEMNAPPTNDPLWPVERPVYRLNLNQQAAFMMQAAGLGLAAGAERMSVYKFYDWALPPGGETFGLLRADTSRRPAFAAWQTVIRHLNGVEHARTAATDSVQVVYLRHEDGRQTVMGWARTEQPTEIRINATAENAELLDQYGNISTVQPNNGSYTIALGGAVCNLIDGCPVGGNVRLLVQAAGEADVIEVYEVTRRGNLPLMFE